MSNSKMLIDAAHPEETRVVVLKGNRIEEFDFESASKKQLRGNIYLAKVTRVEPSLQAAFVEYGGNRHGFLAFSEIHPDYYQIPVADRQALLEEEARANRDEDDEPREAKSSEGRTGEGRGGRRGGQRSEPRADKEATGGEGRQDRNARGEGRGDRDGRGGREARGERGQRRSRRHRRDDAPATPLDRRGPADESVSEPAFAAESDALLETAPVVATSAESGPDAAEAPAAASIPVPSEDDVADGVPLQGDTSPAVSTAEVEVDPAATSLHEDAAATAAARDVPDLEPEPTASAAAADAGTEVSQEAVIAAAEETHVVEAHADDAMEHGGPAVADAEGPAATQAVEAGHEAVSDASEGRGAPDGGEAEHPAADPDAAEHEEEHVEQIGGDALSDVAPRPVRLRRHYKIQEVIKRRQILLIQVVKEERGNKGAALTTYLSLAGRYSVLMPNTAKGGGISRKITDGEDRKRLKAIAGELDVPEGMGVILRTAGAARSPIEVRRDFEYLLRMWESVRELTLKSSAPTLVYEEGSLIKRSIRDLFSKDVEEIVVSGEAGFAEARDFMRMLMPGNVKSVVEYRDPSPIFAKSGVEAQLDAMFSAHVTLKSGGYLVINQTEALVAIDVNSGRSTREHNIEDTALRTNMEAADEVARQLRLRDLAGLIVVDFIDMDESRNNRSVERRIKEALKDDRARIQIGRISHFGLLEMSRQRIRTGVLEGSTIVCPHCAGAGTVRSTSSVALHVLRLVEDALIKDATHDLVVRSRGEVALYMLNQKRAKLVELEQRFGVTISVEGDPALTGMVHHAIERGELATPAEAPMPRQDLVRVDSIAPIFDTEPEMADVSDPAETGTDEGEPEGAEETGEAAGAESGEGGERRRKRRRRRRGRDRDGMSEAAPDAAQALGDDATPDDAMGATPDRGGDVVAESVPAMGFSPEAEGMNGAGSGAAGSVDAVVEEAVILPVEVSTPQDDVAVAPTPAVPFETSEDGAAVVGDAAEPAPKRRRSRRTAAPAEELASPPAEAEVVGEAEAEAAPKRRRRPSRARAAETEAVEASPADATPAEAAMPSAAVEEAVAVAVLPPVDRDVGAEAEATAVAAPADVDPDRPKRSGWWQRAKTSFGS